MGRAQHLHNSYHNYMSYHIYDIHTYHTRFYAYFTVQQYTYGMAIFAIWLYGDMKAAEAQTYYRHLERHFSLAATIFHRAEVFEMEAWHHPNSLSYKLISSSSKLILFVYETHLKCWPTILLSGCLWYYISWFFSVMFSVQFTKWAVICWTM